MALFRIAVLVPTLLAVATIAASAGDRGALKRIALEECIPHWSADHDPAPCAAIDISGPGERGVAILKDRVGVAQFLAIPTTPITGVESPDLRGSNAPDLFGAAWRARRLLETRLGRTLPRNGIGMAINAQSRRSQDQAHVHVDCVRPEVRAVIANEWRSMVEDWSAQPLMINTVPYWSRKLKGADLAARNPFDLARSLLDQRHEDIARATVVLIGAGTDAVDPGFVLLVNVVDEAHPGYGHGEDLLDHACGAD